MRGDVARQATVWVAIVLLGAGVGGAAALLGLSDLAVIAAALALLVVAAIVLPSREVWNLAAMRSWRSPEPFQVPDGLDPALPRAVAGGAFAVGVLIGGVLPPHPATLAAGAAGLAVLVVLLVRRPA